MQSKYNIGEKVYVEMEVRKIMSKQPDKVVYEVGSEYIHGVHGWPVGKMLIEEEHLAEVPKVNITGVEVSVDEEQHTVFTAVGENIDPTAEFVWTIRFDEDSAEAKSTGPVLTLSDEEGAEYDSSEKVTVVVQIDEYVSGIIKIKGFEVSITGVEVDDTEGITLTAVGNNLDEEATYTWTLTCDHVEIDIISTGTKVTLSEEDKAIYDAAETVTVIVEVGDYTSESFTLKEPVPVVSIDSITESRDGENNVILTAVGQNLSESDEYGWAINMDGNIESMTSTGTSVTFDATQTADYDGATSVTAVVNVGDYTSGTIVVKE